MAIYTNPFKWYGKGIQHLGANAYLSDDIRIILCTSLYTPDSVNHEFYDVDITNELPTANGYTNGGLVLASKTLTAGASPGNYKYGCTNPSWTAAGGSLTYRYWVLYNNTPASNKPLIGWSYANYNSGTPADVTVLDTYPIIIDVSIGGWFSTNITDGVV